MDDREKSHWAVKENGDVYCVKCGGVAGRTNFISRLMTANLMTKYCPHCGAQMEGWCDADGI